MERAEAQTELPAALSPQTRHALREAARSHGLCERCLGRLVGKVGRGHTNPERGAALRLALGAETRAEGTCGLCEGLFLEVEAFAALVLEALAGWECSTFLLGTKLDEAVARKERGLLDELGPDFADLAEPLKTEMNREVGKRVEARSGKKADFQRPQITALLDTRFDVVELESAPVYLHGRYRKLQRGIPQTRWPCRVCRGLGCRRCGGTGKMYAESVEELVAAVPMRALGAREHAFHGMGREDIDALMLGTGRPFVLELKEPRRRALDAAAAQEAINRHAAGKVEVSGLRLAGKEDVLAVKNAASAKTYVAACEASEPVPAEKLLNSIPRLRGSLVSQRTPARVAHRRADLVRTRRVLAIELLEHAGRAFTLRIVAEAGTYIKELVSSDDGRTEPSLAGLLGVPVTVTRLDVVEVADAEAARGDGATEGS